MVAPASSHLAVPKRVPNSGYQKILARIFPNHSRTTVSPAAAATAANANVDANAEASADANADANADVT